MIQTAVSLKNISKKFRLFESPKDRLKEALHPFKKKYHKEFWALKDISFEVPKGETIGIIGRNGSGKSTLLQIICGVLQPTNGLVTVNGRISALLELGADFSPEFTGRENVLMKGIRNGLSKAEMNERLPEIEHFADIGEFINYPLKTYSSGMFVRLAFATAINIDPEILVVDEALAVGDAKFQHKCYLKIKELQEKGVTIILVTHDIEAVLKHCDEALLLNKGRPQRFGSPQDVTTDYREFIATGEIKEKNSSADDSDFKKSKEDRPVSIDSNRELDQFFDANDYSQTKLVNRKNYNAGEIRIGSRECEILDFLVCQGDVVDPVSIDANMKIDIFLKVFSTIDIEKPLFGFAIKTTDGIMICGSNTKFDQQKLDPIIKKHVVIFRFSVKFDLFPSDYFISLGIGALDEKDEYVFMDARQSMIHLRVNQLKKFDGLVMLDTKLEKIKLE